MNASQAGELHKLIMKYGKACYNSGEAKGEISYKQRVGDAHERVIDLLNHLVEEEEDDEEEEEYGEDDPPCRRPECVEVEKRYRELDRQFHNLCKVVHLQENLIQTREQTNGLHREVAILRQEVEGLAAELRIVRRGV